MALYIDNFKNDKMTLVVHDDIAGSIGLNFIGKGNEVTIFVSKEQFKYIKEVMSKHGETV